MSLPVFQINSAEFQADPIPKLREIREAGEIVGIKLPIFGTLPAFTTYAGVDGFLRDSKRFARDGKAAGKRFTAGLQWWMPKMLRTLASNMMSTDGPDHRRLRALVDQAFLKRNVDAMHDDVVVIADRLLDGIEASSGTANVDLLSEFCQQFPLSVICELLGLPDEDRPTFSSWFKRLGNFRSVFSLGSMIPGLIRARRYLQREIESCRANPKPGLITELVLAEQEGGRLSEEELVAMIFLLLVAGHETTTHLIADGLINFFDFPEQRERLESDWSLANSAVDETLRYVSPVQMTKPRYVTEDMEIAGRALNRGDLLIGLLASANYDPDQFPYPERFDITRSPNRHLSFGSGIHVCLGLKLAKMETAIAWERLFTRYPDIHLAVPREEVRWRSRIGVRSLDTLPVALR